MHKMHAQIYYDLDYIYFITVIGTLLADVKSAWSPCINSSLKLVEPSLTPVTSNSSPWPTSTSTVAIFESNPVSLRAPSSSSSCSSCSISSPSSSRKWTANSIAAPVVTVMVPSVVPLNCLYTTVPSLFSKINPFASDAHHDHDYLHKQPQIVVKKFRIRYYIIFWYY